METSYVVIVNHVKRDNSISVSVLTKSGFLPFTLGMEPALLFPVDEKALQAGKTEREQKNLQVTIIVCPVKFVSDSC